MPATLPPLTTPVTANTLCCLTSSVAAGTAVGGPAPSSRTTTSALRPPSLPPWVSRYSSRPARVSSPTAA